MSKDYATEERQFTEFMAKLPEPTQFMKDFKWGEIFQGRQYIAILFELWQKLTAKRQRAGGRCFIG